MTIGVEPWSACPHLPHFLRNNAALVEGNTLVADAPHNGLDSVVSGTLLIKTVVVTNDPQILTRINRMPCGPFFYQQSALPLPKPRQHPMPEQLRRAG